MIKKCLCIFIVIILTIPGMMVVAEESNLNRSIRDELEQQQAESYDPDRQMQLSTITTDLNTEQEDIKTLGLRILFYLSNENSEACLTEILNDDWFPTMLTEDLEIGQRNYHYDGPSFSGDITVISDEVGEKYTFIRTVSEKDGLIYLEISPDAIRFLESNDPENAEYYKVQTLYTDDGTFVSNEGYVNNKGQAIDGLKVYMSELELDDGLLDAWSARLDDGQTYRGVFTLDGKTTVVTPDEYTDMGKVCYAMQEAEGETIYLSAEGDKDHTFTGDEFGLFTVWDE